MNSVKFQLDLANLLKNYKLDKITGFDTRKISRALWHILCSLYDLPTNERVD